MQIHVAIIEDEKPFITHLSNLLQSWAREMQHMINIRSYSSGYSFFMDWENGARFDIIFIDVILPDSLSGIQIAKLIRKTNESVSLVFVTSVADEIAEGYRVSAMQYLIKPARYEDVCECMDKLSRSKFGADEATYSFSRKGVFLRIPYSKILYFSSALQYTDIHTFQGTERQLERLKNIESTLPEFFVRSHRSYIINLNAVYSLSSTVATMINQVELPISRGSFDLVRDRFTRYFGNV